ncbi:MAG: hypothetical protein ABJF50_06010 [Paracoccaceae bacterium]
MRILIFCLLMAIPCLASASTVDPFETKLSEKDDAHVHPFEDAINAYELSYRDVPGTPPLPVLRMSVQLPLVMGLGWWLALVLPQTHRRIRRISQPALAAAAKSRIR